MLVQVYCGLAMKISPDSDRFPHHQTRVSFTGSSTMCPRPAVLSFAIIGFIAVTLHTACCTLQLHLEPESMRLPFNLSAVSLRSLPALIQVCIVLCVVWL